MFKQGIPVSEIMRTLNIKTEDRLEAVLQAGGICYKCNL